MLKRLLVAIFFFLIGSIVAMGQTNDVGATPPSREDVLKFLDVLRVKPQLTQYFAGVAKQAKLGAEEGFKQKVSKPTPQQLAEVDRFAETLFKSMPVDEMVDAMVPIDQKHLAKEDMDAILAFYASPVGQKLQREQPAMMEEGLQVGGEIGRKHMATMMQQLDEFITKMAQKQQTPAKP